MTKVLPLLLWVLVSQVVAAPLTQSTPAKSVPAEARLIAGDSVIENGDLVITVRGDGTALTPWTHLFLDTVQPGSAFIHSSGQPAGASLDFLIESGNAYRFSGHDSHEWNWTPIPGAVLSSTVSGDTTRWVLSLASLAIAPQTTVRAFAVTYTPDYQDALDTLPRDNATWRIHPTTTVDSVRPPIRADARQAFRQITSYACYYGPGNLDELTRRDASIIQTKTLGRTNINALRAANRLVIGYISIGEDDELRTGDTRGPGGFDSAYFDRDRDNAPDRNGIWNSYFANAASPAWRDHFLAKAADILKDSGVDGLFLDTVETCLLYPETKPAMVSLIKELRARHPDTIIVINRAWDLLPDLGDTVDGIMFESFTLSYDFGSKSYIQIRASGLDAGLEIWTRLLKPAHEQHGIVLLALDYSNEADDPGVASALNRAATLGMIPCFATIQLDKLHTPTAQGRINPNWLHPRETTESRTLLMDSARNGFPAGTRVSPDSNYNDYAVAPVVDGLGSGSQRESIGWRERAWASRETTGEHSLEFILPTPVSARTLQIEWAWEAGAWSPARSFLVEALTAGAAGAWQTIARFEGNASPTNQIVLPTDEFTGLRIVQNDGGGSPGRPNLMWVQQVHILP